MREILLVSVLACSLPAYSLPALAHDRDHDRPPPPSPPPIVEPPAPTPSPTPTITSNGGRNSLLPILGILGIACWVNSCLSHDTTADFKYDVRHRSSVPPPGSSQ